MTKALALELELVPGQLLLASIRESHYSPSTSDHLLIRKAHQYNYIVTGNIKSNNLIIGSEMGQPLFLFSVRIGLT